MEEFTNVGHIIGKGQYTMKNNDSHNTILHYVLEPCSDIGDIRWEPESVYGDREKIPSD